MRLHTFVVAMAMTGALSSSLANALGLGEVTLRSSLNQPLDAEIELLQLKDLTRNEVLPALASRNDFQRAGISRPLSLSGIQFKTKMRNDGTGYIHVTSIDPVQEPFLNFLMEVHWPSGRLLREYTLLLDPPVFSEQAMTSVQPAETQPFVASPGVPKEPAYIEPKPISRQEFLSAPESRLILRKTPDSLVVPDAPQVKGERKEFLPVENVRRYEVQGGDNLWSIARAVRPSGELSVQQTMVAVQRLNPNAFMHSNINELKKGEVLRIPDMDEILSTSYQDSVADVARQNREWLARKEQLDASRRTKPDVSGGTRNPDGHLSIVGADNASDTGQDLGGGTGDAQAIENQLMLAREKMDELSRENEELRNQMRDLDDQIDTLNSLIELKDTEMAMLQSAQGKEAQPPVVEEPESSAEKEGFIQFLLSNPLMLLLAATVPLGLAGALLVYRRRKRKQDDEGLELEDEDNLVTDWPLVDGESLQEEEEELVLDESLAINEDAFAAEDTLFEETPQEAVQQTQDVLSEVDIYIAYGRFPQAIELLDKSIAEEPGRSDLRLKLLEVHAEANDLDSFQVALDELEALGDDEANQQAEVFKARFPGAFGPSAEDTSSGEGTSSGEDTMVIQTPEVPEASDEDLTFDFDELDNLNDTEADSQSDPALDLDFSETLEEDLTASEFEEETDALPDFDLDDLDDLELEEAPEEVPEEAPAEIPEEATPEPAEETEEIDLDLDLDLEDSAESEGASSISQSMSDFEASLDDDDDLDFLSVDDEVSTKLDLARAYLDMGDQEGAREILQEVLDSGNDEQKSEAEALIQSMDG